MVLSTSVPPFCIVFNASSHVLFPSRSSKPRLLADVTPVGYGGDRREIRNRITRILPFGAPTLKDRRAVRGGEINKQIRLGPDVGVTPEMVTEVDGAGQMGSRSERDAKETTLIVEQGDGTRPGALDEDDPLLLVPDRDMKETSWGARMLSKGVSGLGVALKELHRRLSTTGRAAGEGRRSRPTEGRVRPGRPQEVPRV